MSTPRRSASQTRPENGPFYVSILFIFLMWSLTLVSQDVNPRVLSSHILEFGIQSTTLQVVAYVGMVSSLAVWCFIALFYPRRCALETSSSTSAHLVVVFFVVAALILCEIPDGFLFGGFLGLCCAWVVVRTSSRRAFNHGIVSLILLSFLIFYLLFSLTLPAFSSIDIGEYFHLVTVESHYAVTVLPGFDLLSGAAERSNYGMSTPILVALMLRIFEGVGLSTSALSLAVAVYQIVVLGMIITAFLLLNRRYWLLLSVLMIVVVPSLSTLFNLAISFPNQSGLRYFSLMFWLLFFIFEVLKRRLSPVRLAVYSAFALVGNFETGLAYCAGVFVYLLLMLRAEGKGPGFTLGRFGIFLSLTACLSLGVAAASNRLLFGGGWDIASFSKMFASGYGGVVSEPSLVAAAAVFFGTYALIRGVKRAGASALTFVDGYQAALGTMVLVWMVYYINREEQWNLWFQTVLLLLMWAPRFRIVDSRIFRGFSRYGAIHYCLAASLLGGLLVSSMSLSLQLWRRQVVEFQGVWSRSEGLAGMYAIRDEGLSSMVSARLDYLESIERKERYLLLSHLPTQVRLMGFNKGFPWYEPFAEVTTKQDLDEIVTWIDRHGPPFLMLENLHPKAYSEVVHRAGHLHGIGRQLKRYSFHTEESGWLILVRSTDR